MGKDDEKADKKSEILELLKTLQSPSDNSAALLSLLSSQGSRIDPMTLLIMYQMMQPKQQGIENLIQGLIAWRMAENMLEERKGGDDDIMKILKYQILSQMFNNGNSQSKFDEMLKFLAVINQNNPKELETIRELRESLKEIQNEQKKDKEIENITKEHQKQIEEMKKSNENTIAQMKEHINTLLLQLSQMRSQPERENRSFFEELEKVTELNNAVKQYAEMMGWGPKQGLPAKGEEWQAADYLKAIEQIGTAVTNVIGGFAAAQASKKEKKQVQQIPMTPPPQTQTNTQTPQYSPPQQTYSQTPPKQDIQTNTQNEKKEEINNVQAQQTVVEKPQESGIDDPELEDYINSMQETPEGFIDKYGVLYKFDNDNRITLEQFKRNAMIFKDDVRRMMETSKKAYEEEMEALKKSQAENEQVGGTGEEGNTETSENNTENTQ
jgi:hypothetical protein